MTKLSNFLWFDNQAEEAATLYISLFADGRITRIVQIPLAGKNADKVMKLVEWEMNGQSYSALDGGPLFPHSPAFSFVVNCDTQEEIDHYWDKLTDGGGAEVECGWLRDKFGVSWQIMPAIVPQYLAEGVGPRAEAMMRALREMVKIDMATLQQAYNEAASD